MEGIVSPDKLRVPPPVGSNAKPAAIIKDKLISSGPSEDVVIRTMQDDLNLISEKNGLLPSTNKDGSGAKSSNSKVQPLAATEPQNYSQKVVFVPQRKHRYGGKGVSMLVGIIIIILMLVSVGAAWLLVGWWGNSGKTEPSAAVLPDQASVIMQYFVNSADVRASLVAAWSKRGGEATVSDLLRGDPRLLLSLIDVSEFYYVLLENDPRPYLVVPVTTSTKTLLTNTTEARVTSQRGWYIAHSVATEPYTQALGRGSQATQNQTIFEVSADNPVPVRLLVNTKYLLQIREGLAGTDFANGMLKDLLINARLSKGGFELAGQTSLLKAPVINAAVNQQLLSLVPGSPDFVKLGANFAEDLQSWAANTSGFEKSVLDQPQAAALIKQLASPYAFFAIQNDQGVRNIGLIIELPKLLKGQLFVGDQAIERSLSGLIKMLTGKPDVGQLAFSNGKYNSTPIKYLNLSGSAIAIDYSVSDKYLFIATSKDVMFQLIDTAIGGGLSVATGSSYQRLLSNWGAIPNSQSLVMGSGLPVSIRQLLPAANPSSAKMPFGLSFSFDVSKTAGSLGGLIELDGPSISQ